MSREALLANLRALPKVELHLHLEGSLRPELLLRLAERNRVRLPFAHPDDFPRLCRYRDFRDFVNVLLMGVRCLRQPQDFYDAVAALGAALALENVRYAEVSWTPQFYLDRGHPLDALLAAMNAARVALRAERGVEIRWIPDLVRSYPAPARHVAAWACSPRARAGGVVALGLAGPEAGHPAARFAPIFALARMRGLPVYPHAGEGMGAASVRATLAALQPSRLAHGVRAYEDPALVTELARRRLPLDVCLTSNVRLGVYADYAAHPVKRLIDAGCVVTLGTDDPVLFGTTLSEEYLHALDDCGLLVDDLTASILAAADASHLPSDEKHALRTTLVQEFQRCMAG